MKKALVAAALMTFLSGCFRSTPPYTSVQRSAANPIGTAKRITLTVNNDPETAFINGLDAKQKTEWEQLKASLDPHVKEGFSDVHGDSRGTPLEVFKMQTATKKGMGDVTVWQGLPVCAWSIGALIAGYVGSRGDQG